MNPLAIELNETIKSGNPNVYALLSEFGRELYYPKGILTQTAEAKEKANRHDATIGIAKERAEAMHLECMLQSLNGLEADDAFPYAATTGKPELRKLWAREMVGKNPSLEGKKLSLPIVTSGLTHGLSVAADLFVNPGDTVILPDKIWGNYRMMFGTKNKAVFKEYAFFNGDGGFNTQGFSSVLKEAAAEKGKIVVILNFPHNPTGYSLTRDEALAVSDAIIGAAEQGCNVVAIMDDAYFGLFYEPDVMKESLFGLLAGSHPRILAVKLDGATKEDYVWGFRVGFITFGIGGEGDTSKVYEALEKKAGGCIRALISNCAHVSQSIILKAMSCPDYEAQKKQKFQVMKARAEKVKEVLAGPKYTEAWEPYPFNSGYFMCLRLKNVDAEQLRKHLLERYGVGVIALDEHDVRIAFSCLELGDIEDLFDIMFRAVQDLKRSDA